MTLSEGKAGGSSPATSFEPDDLLERATASAYRILDAAQQSKHALEAKLVGKGYSQEIAQEAAERLAASRYVDDRAFGEALVRRSLARGHGLWYAKELLGSRGIGEEDTAEILDADWREEEVASGIAFLSHGARTADTSTFEAEAKARGALQRRGYSFDVIPEILSRVREKSSAGEE